MSTVSSPISLMRTALLIGLVALLAVAVVLVLAGSTLTPQRTFRGNLRTLFPTASELPLWVIQFRPVAESAEMQKAVGELLNFDDAAYAVYANGSTQVSLYAAYWSPGKMSHRLIAGHTPDVCWVGAGWELMKAERTDLQVKEIVGPAEDHLLRSKEPGDSGRHVLASSFPLEYREFKLGGRTEFVVFCHLVGGRTMSYGTEGVPPWFSFLWDLWVRGLRQREEQFFVRISSNRPLAESLASPPVRMFLRQFFKEALPGNSGVEGSSS